MVDPLDVLANTADGVCGVDSQGRIVLWNDAAERILGYSARDALGKPCSDVLQGRDPSGNRLCYTGCHVLTMVRQGERVQNYDMETQTRVGRPVWLNVSIIIVPGSRRGQEVTVHLLRDVTYLHRLQELVRERGSVTVTPPPDGNAPELTRRELQILRQIAEGHRTDVVAGKLNISEATVRNHVQNILAKLDAHSRLEAVALAMRHHLL